MRKILSYLRLGLTAGVRLIYVNLRYFRSFARHPEKYPFEYRYKIVRKTVIYVLKHYHVDYKIEGFENFLDLHGKCLVVSNHHSDADPLVMIANHEKPITFISKQEAFDFPVIGNGLKALEGFSLDRANVMNQITQIRDIVAHLKDENKPNIVVYIEGTRNKNPEGDCLPFHAGTLKISKMAGVPVVPMTIYGTSRILSSKSFLKRYPVFLNYLKPIDYSKYDNFDSNTEAVKLKELIDKTIDEVRKKDFEYVVNQRLSRRRKALETIIDIKKSS